MQEVTKKKVGMLDYDKYNDYEKHIGEVEEKVIREHWKTVVEGNDVFEDMSSPEMSNAFWMFRHGWIASQLFIKKDKI